MGELIIEDSDFKSQLAGKVVVITGGSSGIGLATAKVLLSCGAVVVVGDLNPPPISPTNLDFFRTDVTSWEDLSSLFKRAKGLHGSIDHVFANAGVSGRVNYLESTLDEDGELVEPSRLTFNVNLHAMVNTCYLALHYLRNKDPIGGSIVCAASASSFTPFCVADYTTTKHGVLGFMRATVSNLQHAKLPIRMNSIAPELTRTGMVPEVFVRSMGLPSQGPEVPARSVALLMADEQRQGQCIYSVEGKHYEIERSVLIPAAREITGDVWGANNKHVWKALEMGDRRGLQRTLDGGEL